jgi:hypothetical protein
LKQQQLLPWVLVLVYSTVLGYSRVLGVPCSSLQHQQHQQQQNSWQQQQLQHQHNRQRWRWRQQQPLTSEMLQQPMRHSQAAPTFSLLMEPASQQLPAMVYSLPLLMSPLVPPLLMSPLVPPLLLVPLLLQLQLLPVMPPLLLLMPGGAAAAP